MPKFRTNSFVDEDIDGDGTDEDGTDESDGGGGGVTAAVAREPDFESDFLTAGAGLITDEKGGPAEAGSIVTLALFKQRFARFLLEIARMRLASARLRRWNTYFLSMSEFSVILLFFPLTLFRNSLNTLDTWSSRYFLSCIESTRQVMVTECVMLIFQQSRLYFQQSVLRLALPRFFPILQLVVRASEDMNDKISTACAEFAGGFVPVGTEVVVTVGKREENENAVTIRTRASEAPSSPSEAVVAIAEACEVRAGDVRAHVFVLVGGADGDKAM